MVYQLIIQISQEFELLLHIWKITIRSGHNFAHATTAQLSWHVQKLWSDLIIGIKMREFHFHKISVMCSETCCEIGPCNYMY